MMKKLCIKFKEWLKKQKPGDIFCTNCKYFVCNFLGVGVYYSDKSCYSKAFKQTRNCNTPIHRKTEEIFINVQDCHALNWNNNCEYFVQKVLD